MPILHCTELTIVKATAGKLEFMQSNLQTLLERQDYAVGVVQEAHMFSIELSLTERTNSNNNNNNLRFPAWARCMQ